MPDIAPGASLAGFREFLGDVRKLGPMFGKHLRIGSVNVAKHVVNKSKQRAATPHEVGVAKGLQARADRIPTISVSTSRNFASRSRPPRRRSQAVKIIDVWFGAEFGGQKHGAGNPTARGGYTTQFRPHKGTQGYFFYPTVRSENRTINNMYAKAVEQALRESRVERATPTVMRMMFGGR